MDKADISKFEHEEEINFIILIQNTFRSYKWKKDQKEFLFNIIVNNQHDIKFSRIWINNFQSMFNNKAKLILSEKIESLDYKSFEKFKTILENPNYDEQKIFGDMKKARLPLYPIAMRSVSDYYKLDFYWGEWDRYGNQEGFGIKIFSNGAFYFGTFKQNKMDGVGIFLFPDKSDDYANFSFKKREDQFKFDLSHSLNFIICNKFNSKDDYIKNLRNEDVNFYQYIGEFTKDKLDGYGELTYKTKDRYTGEFYLNEITNGTYHFKDKL